MCLVGLLLMQGFLYMSAAYRWFGLNYFKGFTVLLTIAATAVVLVLLVGFVLASWFTKSKVQFSVAALLFLVPVVAIPCAWFAQSMNEARQQADLVKELDGLGVQIWRDREPWVPGRIPASANPLVPLLGRDFFDEVSSADTVVVQRPGVLPRFKQWKRIKTLMLFGPKITDLVLEDLRDFTDVTDLRVESAPVTDLGISNIQGLTRIESLRLDDTDVTDRGLECLKGLTRLSYLSLNRTKVTGAGMQHLSRNMNLSTLFLIKAKVDDDGLMHFRNLTNLRSLNLGGCARVTDDGAKYLAGLTQLEDLGLGSTQITDAGLKSLQGLRNLRDLWIGDTNATPEGVAQLQQFLPKCKIHYAPRKYVRYVGELPFWEEFSGAFTAAPAWSRLPTINERAKEDWTRLGHLFQKYSVWQARAAPGPTVDPTEVCS